LIDINRSIRAQLRLGSETRVVKLIDVGLRRRLQRRGWSDTSHDAGEEEQAGQPDEIPMHLLSWNAPRDNRDALCRA
jgi:hypothetical protein